MGRSRPLDHPELLEVQALLDQSDVAEAQRQLARLGNRPELAHGVTFLTTRLLHLRGRLDHAGVAERLRDLVAEAPDFQEAIALLSQSEATANGSTANAAPIPARSATPVVTQNARVVAAVPAIPWTPQVIEPPPVEPAVRPSLEGPRPPSLQPHGTPKRSSRPSSKRRGNGARRFTPVTGFETEGSRKPQASPAQERPGSLPQIPRAPAIPQFRDNNAPPSYAPDRRNTEPDLFKGKSLLPRNAGRYSETPTSADIVEPNRPRRGKGQRAPSIPASQRHRETVPHTPERIRSAAPPPASAVAATLFDIASWIDEGRFRDAVAAINRAGPNAGPEYAVLRARALAGAGYVDQATDLLEQLERDPSPDPELRAATARLFVELGDPGRALRIAKAALDAEPDRPLVRLTYALAAIRACRRQRDPALLRHADVVLQKFAAREGPLPALYLSLRACILSGMGDPNHAISTAQRALGLDSKSPDAFAAIAEAATQLGRVHDARQAWSKLAECAPAEAEAMSKQLPSAEAAPAQQASMPPRQASPLWSPLDAQLVAGRRGDVLRALERSAQEATRRIAKATLREDFTAVAMVGASFLTTSPVFSSFAPYDASLWSLRRLEAALDLVLGRASTEVVREQETGLVTLIGAYLGESLRLAHAGRWEGRSSDLDSAKVLADGEELYPFRAVSARLHSGRHTALASSTQLGPARPGSEQWRTRFDNPVAPPIPWGPSAWPPPSQLGAIGRSLSQSPIARFCEETAEGPLDRTTSSLIALDTYLDLIAPRGAAVDADAAWTRRVSVLAGGYLGETLRELVGGEWVYGVDAADDAHAFRLRLRGSTEALPVAQVLERVIGTRTSSLVDYARTLMRRAGR